jgi:hypothetical protein
MRGAVDVRADEFGVSPGRADLLDNLGATLAAASVDDDVRPFGRERGRDRAADVAGGSGDERGLALESCAHLGFPSLRRRQMDVPVSGS